MMMEESVQHVVMTAIQEVRSHLFLGLYKAVSAETSPAYWFSSLPEKGLRIVLIELLWIPGAV